MHPLATQASNWTLTDFGEGEQQKRMTTLPMRELIVGRTVDADFCVAEASVSKRHAKIWFEEGEFFVQDLSSTNGTFLNCKPIQKAKAVAGDLLQFANSLYRVGKEEPACVSSTLEQGILPWAQTLILFDQLISDRAVTPFFQPIIVLNSRETIAYELLARSKLEGLTNPAAMFNAADKLGQNATLSELMREEGLKVADSSAQSSSEFYLNTHPCEVVNDRLIDSLRKLRSAHSNTKITLEIHEAAVIDPGSISELRTVLNDLNIRLSYDDFGAGQGRLLELGEQPPDVLKFDMKLIRDIDKAPATRQDMLATLVRLAVELGTTPLAEGVETEAEHETCLQLQFELGQGFYYGRPAPFQK